MQIDLSKKDAALIQYSLARNVTDLKTAIRETNDTALQFHYAETITAIRELQSRIERAQ